MRRYLHLSSSRIAGLNAARRMDTVSDGLCCVGLCMKRRRTVDRQPMWTSAGYLIKAHHSDLHLYVQCTVFCNSGCLLVSRRFLLKLCTRM